MFFLLEAENNPNITSSPPPVPRMQMNSFAGGNGQQAAGVVVVDEQLQPSYGFFLHDTSSKMPVRIHFACTDFCENLQLDCVAVYTKEMKEFSDGAGVVIDPLLHFTIPRHKTAIWIAVVRRYETFIRFAKEISKLYYGEFMNAHVFMIGGSQTAVPDSIFYFPNKLIAGNISEETTTLFILWEQEQQQEQPILVKWMTVMKPVSARVTSILFGDLQENAVNSSQIDCIGEPQHVVEALEFIRTHPLIRRAARRGSAHVRGNDCFPSQTGHCPFCGCFTAQY